MFSVTFDALRGEASVLKTVLGGCIDSFAVLLDFDPTCEEIVTLFSPQDTSTITRRKKMSVLEMDSFGDFLKQTSFTIDPP
jgi:hypothetical protein